MTESTIAGETLSAGQIPRVIKDAVRLIAPHRPDRVDLPHQLVDDLGFHSLALAELGFALEDLFRLDVITPERAMAMKSVGDIVELVEATLRAGDATLPPIAEVEALCLQYGAAWAPEL